MRRIYFLLILVTFSAFFLFVPKVPAQLTLLNPGKFVEDTTYYGPQTLDPASNYDYSQAAQIIQESYEGLVTFVNNSVIQFGPSLALNYSISPNGLQYNFTMRPNVSFALQPGEVVGQPFNAYVMQYSLDRAIIMNDNAGPVYYLDQWINGAENMIAYYPANMTGALTFLNLKSIYASSPTQLTITLSAPFSGFLSILASQIASAVSPKAIIDNEPSTYTTNIANTTFGMVPLIYMFPGMSNLTILANLGLPNTYDVANSGVVPQSGTNDIATYTWLVDHTAGTGPYMLQSSNPGVGAVLLKNVNWWNKANFNPNSVNEFDINQVADVATMISDLQSGLADTASLIPANLSQVANIPTQTSLLPGLNYYQFQSFTNGFIGFNLNDSLPVSTVSENPLTSNYGYGSMNYSNLLKYTWKDSIGNKQYASKNNPFTSLLFREAFANAFDYNTYIQQILYGLGNRMEGVIPAGMLGHDSSLIANNLIPSFNPANAKLLFQTVGWKGNLTLYYNIASKARLSSLQQLKSVIEGMNIGINISIVSLSFPLYLQDAASYRNISIYQFGWIQDYSDPYDYVSAFLQTGGLWAYSQSYSNPYIDQLINQANNLPGPARASNYNLMEENASQDYPFIYIYQTINGFLVQNWIQGISNPASRSMNPGLFGLKLEYLGKQTPTTTIISSTTSTSTPLSTSSTTTNTSSTVTTSPTTTSSPGTSSTSAISNTTVTNPNTNTTSNSFSSSSSSSSSNSNTNPSSSSSSSKSQTISLSSPGFDALISISSIVVLIIPLLRRRRLGK